VRMLYWLVDVEFFEADVEELPFQSGEFDVVLSQFGHMFAPRPEAAADEMLRVLRPGGTVAFSTWPPEVPVGRTNAIAVRYMPPPPGASSPIMWAISALCSSVSETPWKISALITATWWSLHSAHSISD
jgi:ubiquinone/menaquinone biosynthesis C-methylase UbiE